MPDEIFSLDELSAAFEMLAHVASTAAAIGVADAEVGRYARAVEYGSMAGAKPWPNPGPQTALAVNPDTGEPVVVTVQAPQGFIRTNAAAMSRAMVEQLREPADWLGAESLTQRLAEAAQEAAEQAVAVLRSAAPRDSGRLAESVQIINAG